MNIIKYQTVGVNSEMHDYHNVHDSNNVHEELRCLLMIMEQTSLKTPAFLNVYNLLYSIQVLLTHHETVSRETIFAIDVISDHKECLKHIAKIHSRDMHKEC